MVRHGLSFDIECYYQIVAKDYLRERLAPTSEVVRNTSFILDCLGEAGVKATFFTLGNVARAFPQLIRRIVEEGHELAVHGDEHLYLTDLDPAAFREELARAIGALEDAGGVRITGHRAPAFSLVERT
ncbi:MAG: polysaccharide deacetylase family protein, partial [Hyphomicrobiaceae bacterium]